MQRLRQLARELEPKCAATHDTSLFEVPTIVSSWDDLLEGISTPGQWASRREELRAKYLRLLRDEHAPSERPSLDLQVEEEVVVDGIYTRQLISYNVEADERAHAYLGVPLGPFLARRDGCSSLHSVPAVVALHGTYQEGLKQVAALIDAEGKGKGNKGYLDHLCRRGYICIAPEHFVSNFREPPTGPYETADFHEKHPEWTSVGKFTWEHSIAVDVLLSLDVVDASALGVMGHSLGGHGAFFLAAYDPRIRCCVSNCSASFFRHNHKVTEWARDRWYVYFKHIREGLLAGQMPDIDFHEIIALIAPNAFIDLFGLNDGPEQTQRQRLLMLAKLMELWELHDAAQNLSFYVHGQGHAIEHDARELIYGWLDKHLKPPQVTAAPLVHKSTPARLA